MWTSPELSLNSLIRVAFWTDYIFVHACTKKVHTLLVTPLRDWQDLSNKLTRTGNFLQNTFRNSKAFSVGFFLKLISVCNLALKLNLTLTHGNSWNIKVNSASLNKNILVTYFFGSNLIYEHERIIKIKINNNNDDNNNNNIIIILI